MCSVVGYVGKSLCKDFILEGLKRLEYRGYDSAGFACLDKGQNALVVTKTVGDVSCLAQKMKSLSLQGYAGVGHTRWSTHGVVSDENAHPHSDCNGSVVVVHNGIIENHNEIRHVLAGQFHLIRSATDTELVAHLFETYLQETDSLEKAVQKLVRTIQGAYALVFLVQKYPDMLIVLRKRSPLCVGRGSGEMFVASDVLAFAGKTDEVYYIPDESYAFVTQDDVQVYSFAGKSLPVEFHKMQSHWAIQDTHSFQHHMLKEIFEQRAALYATVDYLRSVQKTDVCIPGLSVQDLQTIQSLAFVACGTSLYAARIAQFYFEQVAGCGAHCYVGSEVMAQPLLVNASVLCCAISQSGETTDTLEALRHFKQAGAVPVAVTNVLTSTVVREVAGYLCTQAGPEIAVASTKAFSTQLSVLYWLAHQWALHAGRISHERASYACIEILEAADVLELVIQLYRERIEQTDAPFYADFKHFIFLGRSYSYPFALEAALKFKEITYLFAEACPAGELKHGTLALVDQTTPVVIFSVLDDVVYQKLLINAHAVKSRHGRLIVFAFEGQQELIDIADTVYVIPRVAPLLAPLAMTGLMQFFIYSIAKELGRPIDKPRNLAKSVTVE